MSKQNEAAVIAAVLLLTNLGKVTPPSESTFFYTFIANNLSYMEKIALKCLSESNYAATDMNVYMPPSIEIIEFHLEKGFASSTEEWEGDSW
ncbi:MAG: hypothetical protein AB9922_02415 [Bacteroidales bacterium]